MKNTILPIAILLAFAAFAQAERPAAQDGDVMYGSSVNAAKFKRLEQLKELIKQGADVNAPIGFNRMLKEGEDPSSSSRKATAWPLDVAVQQAQVDMVKLLLANGAKFHGGELAKAAFAGNQDESLAMVTALIEAGADANSPAPTTAIPRSFGPATKETKTRSSSCWHSPASSSMKPTLTEIPRSWRRRNMAMRRLSKCCSRRARTSASPALAQKESEKRQAIVSKLQSYPK